MKMLSGKGQTYHGQEMDHHGAMAADMIAAHADGKSFHHGLPDGHEDSHHAAAMAAGAKSSVKTPQYGSAPKHGAQGKY